MSNITNPEDLKLPAASVATDLNQVADEKLNIIGDFEAAVARASAAFFRNTGNSILDNVYEESRYAIKAVDLLSDFDTWDFPQYQNKVMKRPASNGQTANEDVVEQVYRQLNKDFLDDAINLAEKQSVREGRIAYTPVDLMESMGMITYPQLRKLFDEALEEHRDCASVANKKVKK